MEKSERKIGTIMVLGAGTALCILALFAVGWLVDEAVSARMRMSFESEPPEGYSHWYWKELRRQMPEAICYLIPIFAALVFAVRSFVKCIRSRC